MELQVEYLVMGFLIIVFLGWTLWLNLSRKYYLKKYNKTQDGRNNKEGRHRVEETSRAISGTPGTNEFGVRTENFGERFPVQEITSPRTAENIKRSRNPFLSRRRTR